jgi:hypothetical protein
MPVLPARVIRADAPIPQEMREASFLVEARNPSDIRKCRTFDGAMSNTSIKRPGSTAPFSRREIRAKIHRLAALGALATLTVTFAACGSGMAASGRAASALPRDPEALGAADPDGYSWRRFWAGGAGDRAS